MTICRGGAGLLRVPSNRASRAALASAADVSPALLKAFQNRTRRHANCGRQERQFYSVKSELGRPRQEAPLFSQIPPTRDEAPDGSVTGNRDIDGEDGSRPACGSSATARWFD